MAAGPDGCLPELDMSPCCKSCVYGICAFVLRCFFSVLTLYSPMEHSLGVKLFSSSLSSCKCCIFLTFPVFLFCLPRCHMYVVYVWTGGWLISLVLVTSDNKGLLLLLLLLDEVEREQRNSGVSEEFYVYVSDRTKSILERLAEFSLSKVIKSCIFVTV